MLARRMLVLVAVLMGITALVAGLSAPPARTPAPAPESPPVAGGAAPAPSPLVERTLRLGHRRTVSVAEGKVLRLTVQGDALDVVELVGLDQLEPIAPESPAVFDIPVDDPGRYPIRLTDAGTDAGVLRVVSAAQ
jgi:hypothetical protein